MKLKNFNTYLEKRLDPTEIAHIKQQAKLELRALKSLQNDVCEIVTHYLADENIGFNELVRRLGMSASQVSKIQKGEANLTLATLAHIAALLNKKPHIVFQ